MNTSTHTGVHTDVQAGMHRRSLEAAASKHVILVLCAAQ